MSASIRHEERDFLRQAKAAQSNRGSRAAYLLSLLVVLFLAVFLTWADQAMLDEVTRGDARIVPSRKVQVIQNLEGGILETIRVEEGDIVEEGQVLVTLDETLMRSSYEETRSKYLNLSAATIRLQAEISDTEPTFPDWLKQEAPAVVADESALYEARQRELDASLTLQDSRIRQKEQEIAELKSRMNQLSRNLGLARKELDITEPLAARGTMSQLDLLRIQRTVSDLSGELSTVRLSVERAQSAVEEARQQKREIQLRFQAEASEQLNIKRAELDAVSERVEAGEDRFARTEVRSPVRGTVKQILKNTVGGVVQPGEDIMEIVPLDDTLLVETRVRPSDIAFLHPDQPATVKLTAYDFSIYGGLDARVERISADTITDQEGNSFYKVYVRTDDNALTHNGDRLPIIPGMTASVDILTGEKSVLDYLLKPLMKVRQEALRER